MQFCVSASDEGQPGPRCDREGGPGPLGAATAGRQGDFLTAVQWNREDVAVSEIYIIHDNTTDPLKHFFLHL